MSVIEVTGADCPACGSTAGDCYSVLGMSGDRCCPGCRHDDE